MEAVESPHDATERAEEKTLASPVCPCYELEVPTSGGKCCSQGRRQRNQAGLPGPQTAEAAVVG